MSFSHDRQQIAVGHAFGARIYDIRTGELLSQIRLQGQHVRSARFTPDDSSLLTAGDKLNDRLIDLATGETWDPFRTTQRSLEPGSFTGRAVDRDHGLGRRAENLGLLGLAEPSSNAASGFGGFGRRPSGRLSRRRQNRYCCGCPARAKRAEQRRSRDLERRVSLAQTSAPELRLATPDTSSTASHWRRPAMRLRTANADPRRDSRESESLTPRPEPCDLKRQATDFGSIICCLVPTGRFSSHRSNMAVIHSFGFNFVMAGAVRCFARFPSSPTRLPLQCLRMNISSRVRQQIAIRASTCIGLPTSNGLPRSTDLAG